MYTVALYTLGCKVSQYETEAVAEAFADSGFTVCDFDSAADVYVINTCTVTEESDRKSRQFIRRAIRKNPDAMVIVMGCYSERAAEDIAKIPGVGAVIGTDGKMRAVALAKGLLSGEITAPRIAVLPLLESGFERMSVRGAPRTRAYVKIEDGCDSKCTYCAIKEARGRVRSKPVLDVIREVEALAKSGIREVVLTGIEVAAYGKDFGEDFGLCELLFELDRRHSCGRIRLGSLAPELIGESFANAVSGLSILVPHFHVSLQSGSDSVLAAMKRRYNSSRALENIKRLKSLIPDAEFTADIMVGFPTESEDDFEQTKAFVKKAELLDAHVFTFSRRKGTPAYDMVGQIPEDVKRDRTRRMIAAKNEVRDATLDRIVNSGRLLPSIFESLDGDVYIAHADTFAEVRCTSNHDVRGKLLYVKPMSHKDGVIYGEIADNIIKCK